MNYCMFTCLSFIVQRILLVYRLKFVPCVLVIYLLFCLFRHPGVQAISTFYTVFLANRQPYIMSAPLAAITERKPAHSQSKSQSQLPCFTWLLSHTAAYRPDSVTQVCRMALVLSPSIYLPLSVSFAHSGTGTILVIQKIGIDQPLQNKDGKHRNRVTKALMSEHTHTRINECCKVANKSNPF